MKDGRVSTKLTDKKVLHMNHTSLAIRHRRLITGHHSWQDGGRFDDRSCSQCGWFGVFHSSVQLSDGHRSPFVVAQEAQISCGQGARRVHLGQVFPTLDKYSQLGKNLSQLQECAGRMSRQEIPLQNQKFRAHRWTSMFRLYLHNLNLSLPNPLALPQASEAGNLSNLSCAVCIIYSNIYVIQRSAICIVHYVYHAVAS